MNEVEQFISECVSVAGMGVVLGGAMCGIVILIDYVITSVFSMMKGG